MASDFKCALPSRAGRTVVFGDQRVLVGRDGVARAVGGEAEAFFARQTGVWQRLESPEEAPSPAAADPEMTRLPSQHEVSPPGAGQVQLRKRRGPYKKRVRPAS